MYSIKILLSLFVLINAVEIYAQKDTQLQNIVFPDKDTNLNRTAAHQNRQPVQDRRRCDAFSELLYPGDNTADWVCDCKPAFLFFPQTQKCYPALTRGPCDEGEYLIITKSSAVPKCGINPCRADGYVPFQNKCYRLGEEDGCEGYKQLIGRKVHLVIDPTTLQPSCQDEDENFKCNNNCCVGGLRYYYGQCDNVKRPQ